MIRWRASARAEGQRRDELIGAIRTVRYELSSNVVAIANVVSHTSGCFLPIELRDRRYREAQFILARNLPSEVREQVARSHETMFIATTNVAGIRAKGSAVKSEIDAIARIGDEVAKANSLLHDHLTKALKAEP